MSGFRGSMASDLLTSGVKLDDQASCALALLATGWRAIHIGEWLDDAMALAQSFAAAHSREAIIENMAREGDAVVLPFRDVSSLNFPGASASGFFGSGL